MKTPGGIYFAVVSVVAVSVPVSVFVSVSVR